MNGIDFILRDIAGWMPPVPLPRRRLRWSDPKAEPIRPEEIEFIRAARGRLSTYDLGECYGVSSQTISNIWAGRCSAGLSPRPARPRAKRKQK
ncbi:hypothetical protein [Achromobacter denitrificans]|uniref:hypothetical protein n=1 Tax=Achromobacter denitrificans TaxID=32002 RepID=UPI00242FBE51|nr:hypothetical protein [Achromobacter denitrificans]MBV2161444.1 hypothetical protein [Achromobacter denitrificans]